MDNISGFIREFVPFFEDISHPLLKQEMGKDVAMMEIRTKSSNIKTILDL